MKIGEAVDCLASGKCIRRISYRWTYYKMHEGLLQRYILSTDGRYYGDCCNFDQSQLFADDWQEVNVDKLGQII